MKQLTKFCSRLLRFLRLPAMIFLWMILSVIAYQYFQVKIYDLPSPKEFTGDFLYNPYQEETGWWLKANFHAHAKSWGGLTNGKQSGDELVRVYHDFGYDVSTISDYQRINESIYSSGDIAVPAYEHGLNVFKQHHLGIGAQDVTFDDVLLWQNNHIKQFLLERMNENSSVVCISHPGIRNGYTQNTIGELTGYQSLEVLNSFRSYENFWDAALSSGRPVWILANDDCHDVSKENIAMSWNLIHTNKMNQQGVVDALRSGSSIGVRRMISIKNFDSLRHWSLGNKGDILKAVYTNNNQVTFSFKEKIQSVRLIGQSGEIRATFNDVDSAWYSFSKDDTYIRAEVDAGPVRVYLNPILRYDGKAVPQNTKLATANFEYTLLLRITILLLYFGMIRILFPSFLRWLLYGQKIKTYPAYEQALS